MSRVSRPSSPRRSSPFGVLLACVLLVGLGCFLVAPGSAEESVEEPVENAARHYFTDVELVTHDGEAVRFYSDLLAGKVVVINTFFSTCEGICPVMSAKLAKVQEWLGDRLGEDVHIVSITVDPEYDTPQVLAEYAERWEAREGWTFVTGDPERVEFALGKLGQWVEDKEAHTMVMLVGNEPTGLWKKANGLAPANELVAIVDSVLQDQGG